jgi:hypothetical protein
MKTDISLWLFVDHFFLEWEMFDTEVVEKSKHTLYAENVFLIVSFMR